MSRIIRVLTALAISASALFGCQTRKSIPTHDSSLAAYQAVATQIEYPDVCVPSCRNIAQTVAPITVRDADQIQYRPLGLDEAIRVALSDSEVLRDIGGTILQTPERVQTVHDVAIAQTDLRASPEAALSAFDAQFATSFLHGRSERAFNNFFVGGGAQLLRSNISNLTTSISKRTATGSTFTLQNIIDYNRNTSPANAFSSVYATSLDAQWRQPLLQGSGIEFNRIAGPLAIPGIYNGVILGRINTDLSLADFEIAVRNLVRDVERAYWELYFAYRDFDAKKAQRDSNLETWRLVNSQFRVGTVDAEREALAREAYYLARELAEDALSGRADADSTGILAAERRLRFLLGLPASDAQLIRPSDEPASIDVRFDWYEALSQALVNRVELRKQKWNIKRRELELLASRNFQRMKLDLVGNYRWAGLGDNLFGNNQTPFNGAFESLFTDGLDDWTIGLELQTPVGNRIGHLAVRNALLQLVRESAIHRDLELKISHDLCASFAELDRAYAVARSRYNRSIAAHQQLELIREKYRIGVIALEFRLDAQERASQTASAYYQALIDYNLALMSVHFERGSLLAYHNVQLSEGPWTRESHCLAAKQAACFGPARIDYTMTCPRPVSCGPYQPYRPDQFISPEVLDISSPEELLLLPKPINEP